MNGITYNVCCDSPHNRFTADAATPRRRSSPISRHESTHSPMVTCCCLRLTADQTAQQSIHHLETSWALLPIKGAAFELGPACRPASASLSVCLRASKAPDAFLEPMQSRVRSWGKREGKRASSRTGSGRVVCMRSTINIEGATSLLYLVVRYARRRHRRVYLSLSLSLLRR